MTNRENFEIWLNEKHSKNSGAPSSYLRCIDILSESFFENKKIENNSLLEIFDIELLKSLHKETLRIQKDKNSFLYHSKSPGYGQNNFYSASIKNYIDFLQSTKKIVLKTKINNPLIIHSFHDNTNKSGLIFSPQLIQRFVASLWTKPFVICSGLSGSGKTKLAQSFVIWITESEKQYKIIPVGADWTNREPLLGYPNGLEPKSYVMPDSGALQLILDASNEENRNKPYFMILDEMNLSHVERYFADFLSIMESGEKLKLYSGEKRYSKYEDRIAPNENDYIPQEIKWPKNLFIIGTVNIDETTYMFSPKVLDRANVIEFRISSSEMKKFILAEKNDLNLDKLFLEDKKDNGGVGQSMGESFLEEAQKKTISKIAVKEGEEYVLNNFFTELQKVGSEFGYRSATEIELLITKLGNEGFVDDEGQPLNDDTKIDIAIMQKLLPKLHGSRNKLTKVLPILGGFCLTNNSKIKEDYFDKFVSNNLTEEELKADKNIKFKISFDKICRMYKNAVENGFASYAEA
jgi:5-methylcytosine-specific restriction protein B